MKTSLIFFLLLNGYLVHAQNESPRSDWASGLHYEIINPAWQHEDEVAVVYEFFSYMCPGCYGFEPIMDKFETDLPESTRIVKIPVALYPEWEPHAIAYYTFAVMGDLAKVHKSFFAAIHQYKKQFRSLEDIADWVEGVHGIDKQAFLSNAQSFAVDSKVRKGKQMAQTMNIGGVPTLVVNGQYKLKFDGMKSEADILDVTAYLSLKKQSQVNID